MTRFRTSPAVIVLSLCAILGAGVAFLMASWLVAEPQQIYRATVSGFFLTDNEHNTVATNYIMDTNPSFTFLVRTTPDPSSARSASYLAEMYSDAQGDQVDDSIESSSDRLLEGLTRVEALWGLEIIAITSWSDDAYRLATDAVDNLSAIDVELFGSDIEPLVVVSQRADRPQLEVEKGRVDYVHFSNLARTHMLSSGSTPDFLTSKLFLEDLVASGHFIDLSGIKPSIPAKVLFPGERNWSIEFEGDNPEHVEKLSSTVGDFLGQDQRGSGFPEKNEEVIVVESITPGKAIQDSVPFSPVITTTASGLFFGLALGWGVMSFLRRRTDQIEAVGGSSPEFETGRRGQT
jgi:hypothetical protein